MRLSRSLAAALSLSLLLAGPAALAQGTAPAPAPAATPDKPVDTNPVVARVNGREIRFEQVMGLIRDLPPQYQQLPIPQLFPMLVKRAVNHELLLEAAEKGPYSENPQLKADVEEFRLNKLREYLLLDKIDEAVTEEALHARYEKHIAETPAEVEVRARHILLKTEAEAKAVIADIQAGKDFAEEAKAKSVGPSAPTGGDLGFFTQDKMVKPFADAAFAMQAGEVSAEPVQTQFGWHVIKVEERRETPRPTFEEMQDELRREMSGEVITALIADLREKATVEEIGLEQAAQEQQPAARE